MNGFALNKINIFILIAKLFSFLGIVSQLIVFFIVSSN